MQEPTIVPIERLELRFEPWFWPFALERRAEIDAHFEAFKRVRPAIWNGRKADELVTQLELAEDRTAAEQSLERLAVELEQEATPDADAQQGIVAVISRVNDRIVPGGYWRVAERLYLRQLAARQTLHQQFDEGLTLFNLGGLAQLQEQSSAAVGYYEQALAIYRELGDRKLELNLPIYVLWILAFLGAAGTIFCALVTLVARPAAVDARPTE